MVETTDTENSVSKCPVKHDSNSASRSSSLSGWTSFFQLRHKNNDTNSISNATSPTTIGLGESVATVNSSSCPVVNAGSCNPASIEEAAKHAQTPHPDQRVPLSTHRSISSIPKPCPKYEDGDHQNPIHQPTDSSKWVYPSEQQFFNAMKRKGWKLPPDTELTIPHVVQIHNAVNERGWREILQWENLRHNPNPRLVRFIGRPTDLSPRARIMSGLWLREAPFDRHDWFVDFGDGTKERRYVIDFYNGKEERNSATSRNGLPSMYLDVRPALDDVEAVKDRIEMFCKDAFPGIYGIMKQNMNQNTGNGHNNGKNER
jgi:cytochrome c heme-lyase